MHTDNQSGNSSSIFITPSTGQLTTSTPTIIVGVTSSSSPPINTTQSALAAPASPTKTAGDIEKAVYGYIRAIRALKRTSVTTIEIAQALGVSTAEVDASIAALQTKGVKVAG